MCKLPPDMKWSFSKLEAFRHCGMMFRLTYLDKVEKENNGFASYGTFCHKLLEEWARGECPEFALAEEYQSRYDDEVTAPFPPFPKGMPQKYYDQGLAYFEGFSGFGDQYEILTAEEKFEIDVDGYTLVGIADLTLRDKTTGGIIVVDHKSKSHNSMKKELETYRMQLYTYAMFVKQKYGVFPEKLMFNMFREQSFITEDFDPAMYEKTRQWIIDTIHQIEQCKDWVISSSSFFCRFVCSVFDACPAKDTILYGNQKNNQEDATTS